MKTIIIHHVEETWRDTFEKLTKLNMDEFVSDLYDFLNTHLFDRIILTQFEHNDKDLFYSWLASSFDVQLEEYSYGWEACQKDEYSEWINGGLHSEILPVPHWLKNIQNDNITICGIFDGECLNDLETLLGHFEISYARLNKFIH